MSDNPTWLGTKETADRLGLTVRTVYRVVDGGELPCYRFGRVLRFKQHEVDEFIERARVNPGELAHLFPEPKAPKAPKVIG